MSAGPSSAHIVGGPFFNDLHVGDRFDTAPEVTLTDGLAASHHAIVGGRLRLAHDRPLSIRVTGRDEPLAHPGLVWDTAIGQSTLVTERAIANLFYRGLAFRRFPALGDTLRTKTGIVGLRPAASKAGRPPRGLAVMRIVTVDQDDRPVLDFHRCALLPAREAIVAAEAGQLEPPPPEMTAAALISAVDGWDLAAYRSSVPGPHFAGIVAGTVYRIEGGDVVSSAPELARLTLNLAAIHHDRTAAANGKRLVYGGHTIGIAAAQITRALPALVTILAWQGCDHTGPVHEDDTLHSEVTVERREPLSAGGGLVHFRSRVRSTSRSGETSDVLEWRLVGLMA